VRADAVTGAITHHGEGPVWDESAKRLLWVDMLRGDVLDMPRAGADIGRVHVASVAACVAPRSSGGLVVATDRGFTLLASDGEHEPLPDVWDDPTVRMNDGGCDPHGRFYCGSMALDASPGRGALFRLDPDRSVHEVLSGVSISNGLAWSPTGATAYYIDSPTQRIDAFAFDVGEFVDRRAVVHIPTAVGMPDGLAIDTDGAIWVALWGGSAVHRYTPDGELDCVVDLPVSQPTSCAFGGDDLGDLFITTSALGIAAGAEPHAGALFHVDPGVAGLPTTAFAA
jgi:sugar lactone lactonase YvrE